MKTLDRELRKQLERVVREARKIAEAGAVKVLQQLAVHQERWPKMSAEQQQLRNRLRAHGRQLGDKRNDQRGTQEITRLKSECAYEHWHRMLFARFLAENDLLIEPDSSVPISLGECRELARERAVDWVQLASEFAVRMLPQIFRQGDPVLEVVLPPETRAGLEEQLEKLPPEVFVADDSLGWVYQFWQADRKEEINASEKKIGAEELPAVTQLFTEDYMVLFLLHNTLGAWWAGKVLAQKPELATIAKSEDELRAACAVGDIQWTYLRFVRGRDDVWRPAAGTFDGWPTAAKEIMILDPCMGSGHFLLFAFPIMVAFRMAEEVISKAEAAEAVLRDNLSGLEIDSRCTQIAAFNLAWTAWRMVGYRPLPQLNLACSGLGINAREEDWLKLAGKDERVRETMRRLYHLFQRAPVLGSLIDATRIEGTLFTTEFEKVRPVLERALAAEQDEQTVAELAVTARGLLQAARMLAGAFTLVATNVPYLGRGKQRDELKEYCNRFHLSSKADLGACFVDRCLGSCGTNGTVALVTLQSWLFQGVYKDLRRQVLTKAEVEFVAKLGPRAFETISGEVVNVSLIAISNTKPKTDHHFLVVDVTSEDTPAAKASGLRSATVDLLTQISQLSNPDQRLAFASDTSGKLLQEYADSFKGLSSGDSSRFIQLFWERQTLVDSWVPYQGAVDRSAWYGGREQVLFWQDGKGAMVSSPSCYVKGTKAWGRPGVSVSQINLAATLYLGEMFDENAASVIPGTAADVLAIWAFFQSDQFRESIRSIDQALKVTNKTLVKVPFDREYWRETARVKYPDGVPAPHSDDPTQWIFDGKPKTADHPLQVAVARLLGYRWPRQTGSNFTDCPALRPDDLERHADPDGIVCLSPIKGRPAADERLRALLADAYGVDWSATKLSALLSDVGFEGDSLDDWLRDGFFAQHCELFHQRPFIWHIWDGRRDGFNALVNYHRLTGPSGEARGTLEKLIFTYLGAWIELQREDQKKRVEGADGRLAAAMDLQSELKNILEGDQPYDLFVRWKTLGEQPIGWEPDLNDGIRVNIRPFMTARWKGARAANACILRVTPKNIKWEKDRGKEPHRAKEDFPWFWGWDEATIDFAGGRAFDGNRWNDLHYTIKAKREAQGPQPVPIVQARQ